MIFVENYKEAGICGGRSHFFSDPIENDQWKANQTIKIYIDYAFHIEFSID